MARFDFWRGSRYSRIPSQLKTPELDETKPHMRDCLTTRVRWCIVFVIVVLAGLGGFTLGLSIAGDRDTVPEWTHSLLRGKACPRIRINLPLLTVHVFFLQSTWAGRNKHSSTTRHSARHLLRTNLQRKHGMPWHRVISASHVVRKLCLNIGIEGQGFVRYPANSPNISAVSAVHQLHCLVCQPLPSMSLTCTLTSGSTPSAEHTFQRQHLLSMMAKGIMSQGI